MKKFCLIKSCLVLGTVATAALGCGRSQKNPVGADLNTIREEGRTVIEAGPKKPAIVTQTIIVERPQLVTKEESTVDDKFLVLTPDPQMTFNEGQKATYKIRARALIPGIKVKLVANNLPDGATLAASETEKDVFNLSWVPAIHTIPSSLSMKTYNVNIKAEIDITESSSDTEKLKGLMFAKDISLFLFRNQELPTDLKISGLPQEITEGQEPTKFTVTVKVPGVDGRSHQKPRLVVSYDGVSQSVSQEFLEMDGSRYVLPFKEAEYLENFKWKFTLVFDTKNISVQPQMGKDGKVMPQASGSRVRLSFKVYNSAGLSTPESLYQMKINFSPKPGRVAL